MEHRIILLNFTEREALVVAKAGYNVERGFLGIYHAENLPFQTPHPLYEYDVLFYNSLIPDGLESEYTSQMNLLAQKGSYDALLHFNTPPHVRISFIGMPNGARTLVHGGVRFIDLIKAEVNVSSFLDAPKHGVFALDELHKLLAHLKSQIAKVGQFFAESGDIYPFRHFPVLVSRSGQQVAGYGTTYEQDTVPRYIVLPQLKSNIQAVVEILQCLENVFPQLFPDRVKRDWLTSDEFMLPDETAIRNEIHQAIAETTEVIGTKKKQLDQLKIENSFVRRLLVATEDSKIEIAERLSGVVRRALEFLGFAVHDIDQKTKSAIKKEDFWVIDGDFLAITEVTGTVHKNPKVKEFNDILGRMATIYKRKGDLVLPTASSISGLLVLNYDIDNHPSKRPRVYTGEEEHIVQTAVEQGIGLLSTVELHRIIVAVKEGRLAKAEARAVLRKPGRVEFDVGLAAKA
jgi:hypothetical protein